MVYWVGALLLTALASVPYGSAQAVQGLVLHNVKATTVDYRGKRAVKITEVGQNAHDEAYALVNGVTFHNGSIDLQLAGSPSEGAASAARGFIGIAFRLQNGHYEYIYCGRPTGVPTIRCGVITQHNMGRTQALAMLRPVSRHQKSTRAT